MIGLGASGLLAGQLPLRLVLYGGVVLGILLFVTAVFTLSMSAIRARHARRRRAVEDDVRAELFERWFSPEPEWERWVEGMDRYERAAAADIADSLLRSVEGSDRLELVGLVDALGIPSLSPTEFSGASEFDKLESLTWLTLMGRSVDPWLLTREAASTPSERAASARLLVEADGETTGIELTMLLGPGTPLTVFGLDTLTESAAADPEATLDWIRRRYDEWPVSLLDQVLIAARHVPLVTDVDRVSWVTYLLVHEEPLVRAGGYDLLAAYGWHPSVRPLVPVDVIPDDPDPRVRATGYRMLASWGDPDALDDLERFALSEPDDRARLAAIRGLPNDRLHTYGPPEFVRTSRWVSARRGVLFEDHETDDVLDSPGLLGGTWDVASVGVGR